MASGAAMAAWPKGARRRAASSVARDGGDERCHLFGFIALVEHRRHLPQAARAPFHRYLESSVGLIKNAVASEGLSVDFDRLGPDDMEYMLELAYQRYVRTAALIGSPESVAPIVEHLRGLGVDEIACLVDFGVEPDLVRQSLPLRDSSSVTDDVLDPVDGR